MKQHVKLIDQENKNNYFQIYFLRTVLIRIRVAFISDPDPGLDPAYFQGIFLMPNLTLEVCPRSNLYPLQKIQNIPERLIIYIIFKRYEIII
jgi:hypothetical protein